MLLFIFFNIDINLVRVINFLVLRETMLLLFLWWILFSYQFRRAFRNLLHRISSNFWARSEQFILIIPILSWRLNIQINIWLLDIRLQSTFVICKIGNVWLFSVFAQWPAAKSSFLGITSSTCRMWSLQLRIPTLCSFLFFLFRVLIYELQSVLIL